MKLCTKCNTLHEETKFNKQKAAKDGLYPWCRNCVKEYRSLHKDKAKEKLIGKEEERKQYLQEYNLKHKERISTIKREYNMKNAETIKAKRDKFYQDNKDRLHIVAKAKYNRDKEKTIAKTMEYRKTEIGKLSHKNSNHKRRTAIKSGDVTTKELEKLFKDSPLCYWCSVDLSTTHSHIDHYMPLIKGGTHTISNLVISCSTCNLQKGTKLPEEFLRIRNGNV
jgi:5-methylcytosine-specific restriction endonuclease McrA